MATSAIHGTSAQSEIPLYRMDASVFARLVEAGTLEGVELVDGLLVDARSPRRDAIRLLDVETYDRMVATGALEGEPVELLDGLLVEMSPQGPAHATIIRRLTRHLAPARAWLSVQLPLEAGQRSEPEPDLALTEGELSLDHHPRTAALVVEVAVTSQRKDRDRKTQVYARAGMLLYWLVDVPAKTVEVRSEPGPDGYGRCEIYRPGARVPSPAEGVGELDVAALFEGVGD